MLCDECERVVPFNGQVAVGGCVVGHRVSQTACHLEVVVIPCGRLGDTVRGEEGRRAAIGGRFPCHGLGAVFTELE